MKKLPVVAIIGRQNVGKSTLFNSLIKDKKSIVDSFPGLTRDIISYEMVYNDFHFILSDTPGLDLDSKADLSNEILDNAYNYLEQASAIILLLENPHLQSFDQDLVDMIRKLNKPTIIAVNKMDNNEDMQNLSNFYELGFNEILPISAKRNRNLNLLLEKTVDMIPQTSSKAILEDVSIAIVGRPNAGKSTLLNALIGYDRAIVSNIPGTTRDSVDEYFKFEEKTIKIIDTAGIRRKSKINESVEFYSFTRTQNSIKNCDVVIHLIDATIGLCETDKKIADEVVRARKPFVIAINKWDEIDKTQDTFEEFKDRIIFKFYKAKDFPIISISAQQKQRIHKLMKIAIDLKYKAEQHIPTPQLNNLLAEIQRSQRIPQSERKIKIYYGTQVDGVPPIFRIFVNNSSFFNPAAIRFIEKEIGKRFNLTGLPILIKLDGKIPNELKEDNKLKTKKRTKKKTNNKRDKKTKNGKKRSKF